MGRFGYFDRTAARDRDGNGDMMRYFSSASNRTQELIFSRGEEICQDPSRRCEDKGSRSISSDTPCLLSGSRDT